MTEWVLKDQTVNQTCYLKKYELWKNSHGSCTKTTHQPIIRCVTFPLSKVQIWLMGTRLEHYGQGEAKIAELPNAIEDF